MAAVGWRFGRMRMALVCALAWVAYPFTGYALQANTNDMIVAAFAIWGFAFATSPVRRGVLLAFASWTKFAPLLLWPLWSRYPRGEDAPPRSLLRGIAGLALGTALVALLLIPGGFDGVRTFWDRTFGFQLDRSSPFSIWDWGIYPGFPDLSNVQTALEALLVDLLRGARLPAAQAGRGAAGRPLRRRHPGLRAGADALVVPVSPVGVPLRAVRAGAALARPVGAFAPAIDGIDRRYPRGVLYDGAIA